MDKLNLTVADLKKDGRMGIVDVTLDCFDKGDIHVLSLIMSKLFIVRAEQLYAENVFRYTCFSPEFRSISEGERYPRYRTLITSSFNGECYDYSVIFEEVKE